MGKRAFSIAALGLRGTEESVLRSICVLSAHSSRAQSYTVGGSPSRADIFIVDAGQPEALAQWKAADPLFGRSALLVEPDAPISAPRGRALKRPLLASRLLGVLDEVALTEMRRPPATLMPILSRPPGSTPAAPAAAPAESPTPRRRHSVLVVDDSPTVRKAIDLALRERAADATLVATGEHALDEIAQKDFDLVLLDVVLPGTDGYQVCKAIKKGYGNQHTPVVMLTSKSSPFDRLRGMLAGCDGYLTKPAKRDDFLRLLDKHLKGGPGDPVPAAADLRTA